MHARLVADPVLFLVNEQPYLDGYYGVLFAYQYVKYGLAPVGTVNTGPSIIESAGMYVKKIGGRKRAGFRLPSATIHRLRRTRSLLATFATSRTS